MKKTNTFRIIERGDGGFCLERQCNRFLFGPCWKRSKQSVIHTDWIEMVDEVWVTEKQVIRTIEDIIEREDEERNRPPMRGDRVVRMVEK